jgi:TolA-binding protein
MKSSIQYFAGLIVGSFLLVSLTGCLVTRQQLQGDSPASSQQAQRSQVSMQQQEQAPARSADPYQVDEQFKELRNRIDMLEHQIAESQNSSGAQAEEKARARQELDQRFKNYEDALKSLEIQVLGLVKDIQDLKKKELDKPAASANADEFAAGEALFEKKEWREAILSYQAYRDRHSSGKNYAEATYKIGVCFQELKMKDEAKAFFSEVISKFPNGREAKKAQYRLKNLK